MMGWRPFSYDPMTGLTTSFDYDEDTDTAILKYEQDAEPSLEVTKALQNNTDYTRHGIKNEFWHYASIPVGIQMKWLIEDGIDVYDNNDWPAVMRKLNDPDYRHLKATAKFHE